MGGREVGGLANQLAAHMRLDSPTDRDRLRRFWNTPIVASRPGLKAVELFDAVLDGRVKALWIVATNPADSMPRADRVRAALEACPFLVVSDCWPTETTPYAHVVLPASAWGEKDGTVTNSERCISRQRKFRDAPGEARPDWWMFAEVARRMGFADSFAWSGPGAIFREHAALSGFENDGERAFDIATLGETDEAAYEAMAPLRWPLQAGRSAYNSSAGRLFANGGFSTSDHRARFVATPYRGPDHMQARPFVLNTGRVRDQWHTMTRTGRVPRLMTHAPEPTIAIHPADAARLGLAAGDLARVETDAGAALLPVAVTAAQRAGELFVPMHWTDAHTSAGPIGRVVTARVDPHSGQPGLKATPASLVRLATRFNGIVLRRSGGALAVPCHWTRVPLANGHLYRLAGIHELPTGDALTEFATDLLGPMADNVEWVEMEDLARGVLRRAALVDNVLEACLMLAYDANSLPRSEAIAPLLGMRVPDHERWRVLIGGDLGRTADAGPRVCACFGVGRATVVDAVREHALSSTDEIGALLSAGTNCGSCLPELQAILRGMSPRAPLLLEANERMA